MILMGPSLANSDTGPFPILTACFSRMRFNLFLVRQHSMSDVVRVGNPYEASRPSYLRHRSATLSYRVFSCISAFDLSIIRTQISSETSISNTHFEAESLVITEAQPNTLWSVVRRIKSLPPMAGTWRGRQRDSIFPPFRLIAENG